MSVLSAGLQSVGLCVSRRLPRSAMRGRWSSIVNRVVRSTNVPIAELPSPMIRSPSQCPGTARSSASAGRSLIMMSEPTNSLPRPRRRALGTRSARPVRKHAVSSRRSAPRPRLPASPPPSSMFHSGLFTLAHDREARAVDEEMQAGTCGGATQRKIERAGHAGRVWCDRARTGRDPAS